MIGQSAAMQRGREEYARFYGPRHPTVLEFQLLSGMLGKEKLPHQVLNAKQHEREAQIVARGFGVRDIRSGAPVTAETMFHLASVSKPFVATAIVSLATARDAGQPVLDEGHAGPARVLHGHGSPAAGATPQS